MLEETRAEMSYRRVERKKKKEWRRYSLLPAKFAVRSNLRNRNGRRVHRFLRLRIFFGCLRSRSRVLEPSKSVAGANQ